MRDPIVGIDAISFYTSRTYLDMADLAKARGVAPSKYIRKIGQEKMAIPPPGEDIVTLGANAAEQALQDRDLSDIDTLILGTESGIDQSKAAAIYLHRLLGLSPRCRVFEVKQACYAGTAALMMGAAMIRQQPRSKVLVVAADVARYGLCTPGEATQGAGAAAMLLSADPKLLALDPVSGFHTEDVMDFWRPNYRDEALVDGKASVRIYLNALAESWQHYHEQTGRPLTDCSYFCYHLPFTRLAEMAHRHLVKTAGVTHQHEQEEQQLASSLVYNPIVGNTYAASLYVALSSLLDHRDDLDGQRIGLFSYGSGCMGEFFTGMVQDGYQDHLYKELHQDMLSTRTAVSYETYERYYRFALPTDGGTLDVPAGDTGRFRLYRVANHQRHYQRV